LPPRWAAIAAASSRLDFERPGAAWGGSSRSLEFTVARSGSHGKCSLSLVILCPHESAPPCKLSSGGMTPESCSAAEGAGSGCGSAEKAGRVTGNARSNLVSAASEADAAILHWPLGILRATSAPVSHHPRMRYGLLNWFSEFRQVSSRCHPPVGHLDCAAKSQLCSSVCLPKSRRASL